MIYPVHVDLALPKVKATNQKQLFEALAENIAPAVYYPVDMLLEQLLEKENHSGSGMGSGVAIPNLKLDSLPQRFIAVATLETPVDFSAVDERPADIICVLLSPESDGNIHLRSLSRISRLFKNKLLLEKLRETDDADTIRSLVINPEGWLLAA